MSGPCGACTSWSQYGVRENLKRGGWGVCLEMPRGMGHYMADKAACVYQPSRFKARNQGEQAIQAAPVDNSAIVDDLSTACSEMPEEIDFG